MPDLSKYSVLQILMLLQKGVLAYGPDTIAPAVNSGKTKIYEELNSGRLRAKKLGDKTIIPFWSAIDWLESLPDYPASASASTDEILPNKAVAELRSGLDAVGATEDTAGAVKNLTGRSND